ncbi:PfkB family carbohydrate kinase [Chloroflexus sp.]|uniref:PfkB family carbohydrate kinase n=1 Tax=Chloroflexus sp. TaxID=1904827 RepID=UPI00298F19A5|nr:PfkB family carbohydrate kinase [Chloroflexus sp.]MCS6888023.1 PfkB family carbohydrate kinase [Chloroflexus sp.]MDW8404563.1 PfkB family carbohydrate kinase [Chloroflexus sp.]
MIDFVAIGHVTRDLLPAGATASGGTARFAALLAKRLGLRPAIVTASAEPAPDGVAWANVAASISSTFENRYTPTGRRQWLHAAAPAISVTAIPPSWRTAPIVLLGPVLHECAPDVAAAFPGALIGATAQGWLRDWDDTLPSLVSLRRWQPKPAELARLHMLALSSEDVGGDDELAAYYACATPIGIVTHGAHGATMFLHGKPHHIAAYQATERDPTGAGDVFATAFLIRLWETGDPFAAARFAAAAAACVVEGIGDAALPDRAQIIRRMADDAIETPRHASR